MRHQRLARTTSVLTPGLALAAALAAWRCAKSPSPADEGARLIAQLKAASGGAALDAPAGFHETGTMVRDGVAGTYEIWADLRVLRSAGTYRLGERTVASGFDGQKSWAVSPDGEVHTDGSPQGLAGARLGTYLTIFGFFYPDRFPAKFESRGRKDAEGTAYDVVTVTPTGGTPADLWLDVKTHRLQRITGTDGTTPYAGIVTRYEVVEGIWVPFALLQTEGEHKLTQQLTSVVFGATPPERLAPPSR